MLTHKNNTAVFGLIMLGLLTLDSFILPIPWIFFLAFPLVYLSILSWGSSQISSSYHLKTLCSASQKSYKEIAITFDDGPDKSITPQVLELLKKHQLQATFFIIGKKISGNETLVKQIVDEGHLVANHSFSHSYFFDFFGAEKIKAELQKTNLELERITGKRVQLFRPPYGVTTPNIASAVESLKLSTIGWNIRSLDTIEKDTSKIVSRVVTKIDSGAIILFHDTNERILSVLEQTILYCKENGFKIVSLNHLLKIDPYAN